MFGMKSVWCSAVCVGVSGVCVLLSGWYKELSVLCG